MQLADPVTQPQFYRDVAGKRLMAWVADTILIALICLLILPFTAFLAAFFFLGLMAVVGFAYRVITLAGGSATLGMRLFAIEFRDRDGARFDIEILGERRAATVFNTPLFDADGARMRG